MKTKTTKDILLDYPPRTLKSGRDYDKIEWARVSEIKERDKAILLGLTAIIEDKDILHDVRLIFREFELELSQSNPLVHEKNCCCFSCQVEFNESQSNPNIVESEAPKRFEKLSNPDDSSQGLINSESTNTSGRDTLDLGDFIYFNGRKIK